MSKITIKELTLENWRGQNAHHVFGENANSISGRNRSGKSSIMAAWYWLICGRTDAGSPANSFLYDNRVELTQDTPTAIVEAVITIDGEQYKIKRCATASFSRRRGTDRWEKNASDSYKFYIDDIERSSSEYKEWLASMIAPDDMLQYVLDGSFFLNVCFNDKKRARMIIEKTIGDVQRSEMKGNYRDIEELLEKFSPEEIDLRAANISKAISKRLDEIPALIATKTTELSEISQIDFDSIDKEIVQLESKREEFNKQILDLSARMKPVLEAKAKAESEKEMKAITYKEAKNNYEKVWIEQDNNLVKEISKADKENTDNKALAAEQESLNAADTTAIHNYNNTLEELRNKREEITKQEFQAGSTCPVCGAALSESYIEKVRLDFIKQQRAQLDLLKEQAADIANKITEKQTAIEERNSKLSKIEFVDTEPLIRKLRELRTKDIPPFAETEQGISLQSDIDSVVIPEVKMPDDKDVKSKIDNINTDLATLYEKRGLRYRGDKLRKDIEDLRSEQREKGTELAKYELQRQLVRDYKQEQMEILSHKINDGLKASRIECWSQLKSGEIVPDLVIKDVQGVAYATTNQASRIATSVDIQRFFCEKLGVNVPCWVDESATVDEENLPHYDDVQTFYLFRADTPLTIETK